MRECWLFNSIRPSKPLLFSSLSLLEWANAHRGVLLSISSIYARTPRHTAVLDEGLQDCLPRLGVSDFPMLHSVDVILKQRKLSTAPIQIKFWHVRTSHQAPLTYPLGTRWSLALAQAGNVQSCATLLPMGQNERNPKNHISRVEMQKFFVQRSRPSRPL